MKRKPLRVCLLLPMDLGLKLDDFARTDQGKHPFVIVKLVGHADLQTAMGYCNPSEDDLRKAIES